ncbi:T9SS type A sorting domain-containing protein [Flavobacterium sp. 20NA77.7]|uniref:T9SS type A sorting domain-containing protein n=1 Tax=Flavobacterium nakdongensis TaxID=3073563 RepID=A0ABY9RAS5_9FLAO|nr:T9SS type A sorting domain-containing protein [Flavobacterium sp. 20NA77.7]WMW78350.1 T9SS type A sorting domain-containing protein [Flavobacterium sp. 20NA77.7]
MRIFVTIMLLALGFNSYCQQLHHEMISSQGGSSVTSSGHLVRYTVGQQSVIGTSTNGYVVQQGFQQSNWGRIVSENTISVVTTVYPNPFVDLVKFSFSSSPGSTIDILVFDILGRLVHSESVQNDSNLISLDLKKLSSAEYLVKLSSGSYIHSAKIIKQ